MKINFDEDDIEDVSLDSYHMTWKEKIQRMIPQNSFDVLNLDAYKESMIKVYE